jgi:formate dehydrogenase major subunit
MYNRASADPAGQPWSERKRYLWWDAEKNTWVGADHPDFSLHKPPISSPIGRKSQQEWMPTMAAVRS